MNKVLAGVKVEQMDGKNGPVKNQFIITKGNKRVFQSYNGVITVNENGNITLDEKFWNYSTTTGKYRNVFLGEERPETERKIKEGTYKLANLN